MMATTNLINHARNLRVNTTEVEKKLWQHLRNRQLNDFKFRRQHPVCGYILDFASEEAMLAIELDGGQHNNDSSQHYDNTRTKLLEKAGWQVLRFWNNDVHENIEGVLQTIVTALTRKR